MSTKILTILAIIVVVGIGGYFGYQYINQEEPNETVTPTPTPTTNPETNTMTPNPPATDTTPTPDIAVVKFETSEGNFEVTLDGKAAPLTVKNFLKLTTDGFYDGLTFHRIEQVQGFKLIQGGDPKGDGTGGPGYTVPAEIKLKHTKGAIAMARTGGIMPDGTVINPTKASSGSQFYIVLEDIPQLDGDYTVFGYVSSGMNVVEKIGNTPTEPGAIPLKEIKINKLTEVETK